MELSPGYKLTEVGIIPEDWDVERIGNLGDVVRGCSPRPAGDPKYFNGNFIPWLTVAALTNIPDHQLQVAETVGFLTEEGSKHSRILTDGTLIIANSGATLGVAKLLGVTCCANDGIAAIINQRSGDKTFICYYFNTRTKTLREVVATGNGQPNLNTKLIREIPIPIPPLPEQRSIASALSDMDELLGALDRLIAKKRDLKQAAMQQLLTGKKRLPGFGEGKGYQKTEVGLIPEDWNVKLLPEISWFQEGPGLRNWQFTSAGIKVINVTNLENGVLNLERTDRHISFLEFNRMYQHFAVDAGDIVMASSGNSYSKTAVVRPQDLPLVMNTSVIRFKPLKVTDYRFLWVLLTSPLFKNQIDLMITGGAQPNFGPYHLKRMPFPIPPLSEQQEIATVLSDMDAEITALEQRRDKTRALKQGMMQELLTGRIRLI